MLKLRPYQEQAVDFLYGHDRAMALAPVGAGKTAIALTAMQEIPDGVIYSASVGYLDVRALDARVGAREGSAHVLAINSRHDLVLAA